MLHLAAFFSATFSVCLLGNRKFEQALPLSTLAAMVVLTALAAAGKLLWVDALAWGVVLGAAILMAFTLSHKRVALKTLCRRFASNILTPGLICFALLTAFFLYAAEPMVVWWKDDIVQWGLEPKSLWIFGGLVDGSQHLNLHFSTYTPGVQVLQWWMMHALGQWQESTLYFMLFMTYGVFLLPFLSAVKWKQAWLIPVTALFMVCFPVWGNAVSYQFLGVDTTLALCFGYTLVEVWLSKEGDGWHLLCAAFGLCGLVLVKQIGLLLAAIAAILLLLTRRCGKRELLCILAPLAVWAGWSVFCGAMGLSGFHTSGMSERISEMLNGTYVPPEGSDGVLASLWNSLMVPYTDSLIFHTSAAVHVPKLVWLCLLAIAPWPLAKALSSKKAKRIAIFFGITTLVYLLIQWAGFFTVFYHETSVYVHSQQDNMILLMERYMAPLLLGMGMLALWLAIEAFPKGFTRLWKPLPYVTVALAVFWMACTVNWNVLYEGLIPNRYIQKDRALGAEAETLMDHYWGTELEGYENAHVLVGLELNSDYIKNFRYTFAPAKFELPELSFTQSPQVLSEHILENKITHLILFDDSSELYAPASALAAEDEHLYTWTLYEVEATEAAVTLAEYY